MLTDEQRKDLVRSAQEASNGVYAPYSNYSVGAALLTSTGKVYLGANVENAAYPSSMCAERVAVFKAVTENDRNFEAMAIVTRDGGSPCGQCRQVLSEFGLDTIFIIAKDSGEIVEESSIRDLRPGAVGPSNLDI